MPVLGLNHARNRVSSNGEPRLFDSLGTTMHVAAAQAGHGSEKSGRIAIPHAKQCQDQTQTVQEKDPQFAGPLS
jgi:hypothetical protein